MDGWMDYLLVSHMLRYMYRGFSPHPYSTFTSSSEGKHSLSEHLLVLSYFGKSNTEPTTSLSARDSYPNPIVLPLRKDQV